MNRDIALKVLENATAVRAWVAIPNGPPIAVGVSREEAVKWLETVEAYLALESKPLDSIAVTQTTDDVVWLGDREAMPVETPRRWRNIKELETIIAWAFVILAYVFCIIEIISHRK